MNISIFVSLHLFQLVIFYLLFLQYEYFEDFKKLYVSKTYETCSTITFLFLLLNGVVLIYGSSTFSSVLCRVLGFVGILICITDLFLYIKLRTEHKSRIFENSRALVLYSTKPELNKRANEHKVLYYIENAIIFGVLLCLVSVLLLLLY